jgi:hypothetical protein
MRRKLLSLYLQIDTRDPQPLASNRGWSDLLRWIKGLPDETAMALRHLGEYGWCQKLDALENDLLSSLEETPPEREDVRETAENLLEMLDGRPDGAEVVIVTDGMSEHQPEGKSLALSWSDRVIAEIESLEIDGAGALEDDSEG